VRGLNPKRRVIRDRVLRRAVTRGADSLYYGTKKQPPEEKEKKTWDEADALTIISLTLMMCLIGIIIKSCGGG